MMKTIIRKKPHRLNNQSGMALLETIPILVVFIVLLAYGLGFFGIVHTGILNSISARAYAFETFRNRANLVYFRDRATSSGHSHFAFKETRFHAIANEGEARSDNACCNATLRELAMGREQPSTNTPASVHTQKIINNGEVRFRKGGVESSPAWIMVGYGICINANCGD
jgi:hypothetical protein